MRAVARKLRRAPSLLRMTGNTQPRTVALGNALRRADDTITPGIRDSGPGSGVGCAFGIVPGPGRSRRGNPSERDTAVEKICPARGTKVLGCSCSTSRCVRIEEREPSLDHVRQGRESKGRTMVRCDEHTAIQKR